MPKPSKKARTVTTSTRAITDFFSRKSASAPPPNPQSLLCQSADANSIQVFPSSPGEIVSVSSTSIPSATKSTSTNSDASSPATPCSSRAFLDTVNIASPYTSVMKTQYLMPPSLPVTKRAGSNSPRIGSLSPHPSPGRSRNPVFDSDSDPERPGPSVYVFRSPARSAPAADVVLSAPVPLRATESLTPLSQIRINPKKKQRLSSPEPCSELVPTSQSDELEIASAPFRQRDPMQVKQNVEEWRHNAASAGSLSPEKGSFNVPSLNVEDSPSSNNFIPSLPPLPTTPQALNPTTKAEQIIAEIKARAYAATLQNRSETPVREFKDELSDSDDDVFPESPMKGKGKAAARMLQTTEPSKRYALRDRETPPSPSAPKKPSGRAALTTRSHVAPTRVPANVSTQNVKGKSKNWNPLDDLLKEKKRNDQRGKGFEAFRQAEAALANRDAIMFSADNEDFTDEAAARKAVVERNDLILMSSSPGGYDAGNSEDEVNEHDHERLLGEKHGKAVASLLNRDKESRRKEKEIEKPVGVPLWHVDEDGMDLDKGTLPKLHISTSHPLLSALQDALDRNDITHTALLLSSGIVSSIYMAENPALIPYLCDLALFAEEILLSQSAMQALTQIWRTSLRPVLGISFACILATLARLGAQPTVLNAMGWTIPPTNTFIPTNKRESLLYRLIALINTSAQYVKIISAELQREIVLAIHAVSGSIASGCDIFASLESTICSKILKYLSTLEPVNKAYITALFASGCGRTRRIGRWIAYGIITDKLDLSPVRKQRYSDLPPILPILAELMRQRSTATDSPGKFEQHDNTDFVDMTFYVRILGVAITNVVGYVMEERKAPRPRISSSANVTPSTQPQEPPLVLLRTALETLHARISDIRATRLDRSRTKAALKELSLRIYYQRQVAQQSFRTLHTYFSKNKKPTGVSA
ncbi:hypothetical protein C0995_007479 [Termitomyces sp. Mi166|nr:hypothetical protein C0995_007479 [Termitomyces sp. Mi166\